MSININNLFKTTTNSWDLTTDAVECEKCLEPYLLPDITQIIGDYLVSHTIESVALINLKKRVGFSIRKELTKGLNKPSKKLLKTKMLIRELPNYFILSVKIDISHYSITPQEIPILFISRIDLRMVQYWFKNYPFSTPTIYDDLKIRDLMYQVRNQEDLTAILMNKRRELQTIMLL
jgi:hypothetical protein